MSKSKLWSTRDILYLSSYSKFTGKIISNIVESYNNLEHFLNSDSKYIYFIQQSLYNDNKQKNRIIEQILENCFKHSIKILTLWDDEYPALLKMIHYPPIVLYVKGSMQSGIRNSIAIVGTRRATSYGKMVTEKFAEYFAKNDIIVVSGLAPGIDTYAHLSAIKNGGITYSIIASGIDSISPSAAQKTAEKILESGGAIISEYPPGTTAKRGYFPQRNRIISGISNATLVVESGLKGGSLITAKFAFDQQRPLFAIPGNINSEKSLGTNTLIKDNYATLINSPEQIFEELNWRDSLSSKHKQQNILEFEDNEEEKIFQFIDSEPKQVDDIAVELNIPISDLLIKLLNLEFKGFIRQLPGKYYIRSL